MNSKDEGFERRATERIGDDKNWAWVKKLEHFYQKNPFDIICIGYAENGLFSVLGVEMKSSKSILNFERVTQSEMMASMNFNCVLLIEFRLPESRCFCLRFNKYDRMVRSIGKKSCNVKDVEKIGLELRRTETRGMPRYDMSPLFEISRERKSRPVEDIQMSLFERK